MGTGILIARNTLRLIQAPRGETAGWITWPLAALGRVEGRPMLAGLKLCLGRNAFWTGAPETRLRHLLKLSREAQSEVSEKLSSQVLEALYELLRGIHRADPVRIEALASDDPHHLYEGLLTCLMRLVFLLYAEDRDLLPSASEPDLKALWEQGYSIKTLYARLLDDEALNPDTMDERRGAWGQLLAVFRIIHEGYPNWVARRGGKLFDLHAFTFLEGRHKGSAKEAAEVLPLSDGTILRILHGLMTVEGKSLDGQKVRERLSYRSLDVESIGSVYETVMGFTAKCASERMIALKDEKKLPNFIGLETLLAQKPAERQKWLKDLSIKLSTKQAAAVKAADDVDGLIEALGSAVDERASPRSTPIGVGVPYLQPTDERRRSGSHYTPRSLTEPIVRHALEPAFERIGANASPEAVLSLKVLDLACGSGAFLVEACRQLGTRLELAWDMHKAEKPTIPPDEDEVIHARRLVAQRCLYGVDRNPMAVDLARLSLWLATLAREHEFSFLDHAIKAGDSLVGLTQKEIEAANWDDSKPGLPLYRQLIRDEVRKALEGREAIRTAPDDVTRAIQESRHRRVEEEIERARQVGDAVIAAFFSADKAKAKEQARTEVESWITANFRPSWDRIESAARRFRTDQGWGPFHWQIEFPEVFSRDNPGFDAIVGNPPFLGGTRISTELSKRYLQYLMTLYEGGGNRADLIVYFMRRAFELVANHGAVGLVATNTVAQGDTRLAGLRYLLSQGAHIHHATRNFMWPGEAAVRVSIVHYGRQPLPSPTLNGASVSNITAFLFAGDRDSEPSRLHGNGGVCFEGLVPYAAGFLVCDETPGAHSSASVEQLLRDEPSAEDVILPFIGGEEINEDPRQSPKRKAFYFADRSLADVLSLWPLSTKLIELSVKPEREAKGPPISTAPWWQFWRARIKLRGLLAQVPRYLVLSKVSKHHALAFVPSNVLPSNRLAVFVIQEMNQFSVLQSRVHECWAKFFGSTLEDRPVYTGTDCFETFPRPLLLDSSIKVSAQIYYDYRAKLMVNLNEGMTKTYNRFHKDSEIGPAIQRLRELHDEMDRAVLRAYGWDDLAETVKPEFLTEDREDDHTYQGRYFWPAAQRDLVLSRLLALNAERYAEEVRQGLHEKGRKRVRSEDDELEVDKEND
ncbi:MULTISPECIES: Eco57I restriction-modification methylase domain-containing protein [unclassified Mesorhizobium]|uniref:Eco57I restriction-modification methylase domain-containing protein n=1 Tax=unclassified Mesorhizobium TaxID=325217 RepID=UPI001CCF76AC|nr:MULTISPECIES: DNA methyltransferase [unclassified Mesorhizobium]MBZ9916577.1 N-6 DNA methylase [Mesorhizobium sp. BR1-1-7]MBZ9952868.1 N-6 DNA methylase [Mesorhizobium sp. BR1-1-15]MBZ9972605.1 N-6 DNA methylase [Mesorhizobium sp. BR1-1-12]